jgi:hypothetical protein
MLLDRALFVPIGVELNASLLHENAAEVFGTMISSAGEIAFHSSS